MAPARNPRATGQCCSTSKGFAERHHKGFFFNLKPRNKRGNGCLRFNSENCAMTHNSGDVSGSLMGEDLVAQPAPKRGRDCPNPPRPTAVPEKGLDLVRTRHRGCKAGAGRESSTWQDRGIHLGMLCEGMDVLPASRSQRLCSLGKRCSRGLQGFALTTEGETGERPKARDLHSH